MFVSSDNGFVWSMNWDSCELPKNSFIAAATGLMLISAWGVIPSWSWIVILSLTTLSILDNPILNWFCKSSPTDLILLFPKWSISSI